MCGVLSVCDKDDAVVLEFQNRSKSMITQRNSATTFQFLLVVVLINMKSPGGHPSDTENGLTIVLQKWMLPMVNSVNQQAVSSLLHKRLEYLRQRILWFSNHRLMDELPPLPIHHSPVLIPKALETKYLEEVGFIDKDTLKSLSFELQCLNMTDLLKTIEMTTTIREKVRFIPH